MVSVMAASWPRAHELCVGGGSRPSRGAWGRVRRSGSAGMPTSAVASDAVPGREAQGRAHRRDSAHDREALLMRSINLRARALYALTTCLAPCADCPCHCPCPRVGAGTRRRWLSCGLAQVEREARRIKRGWSRWTPPAPPARTLPTARGHARSTQ
jgi:hypothetical protein